MSRGSPRWQIYCFPRRLQLRYGAGIACNAHPITLTKRVPFYLDLLTVVGSALITLRPRHGRGVFSVSSGASTYHHMQGRGSEVSWRLRAAAGLLDV